MSLTAIEVPAEFPVARRTASCKVPNSSAKISGGRIAIVDYDSLFAKYAECSASARSSRELINIMPLGAVWLARKGMYRVTCKFEYKVYLYGDCVGWCEHGEARDVDLFPEALRFE